jgi:sugar phosphate isomerase/epimerase
VKLGFSTLGCPEWDLDKIAREAKGNRYQGVELRGEQGEHVYPGLRTGERRKIRELFETNGVEIFSITAYTDFNTSDSELLQTRERMLDDYLHLAQDLGARYLRTFIGDIPPGMNPAEHDQKIAGYLARIAQRGAGLGVRLLMETHDRISRLETALDLADLTGGEEIGILWDIPHSLRNGEIPWNTALRGKNRLAYVHLKDELAGDRGEELPVIPGNGIIPAEKIMYLLNWLGFTGYVCFEWEKKWHPDLPPLDEVLAIFKNWVCLG